jgi:hypothetical protein
MLSRRLNAKFTSSPSRSFCHGSIRAHDAAMNSTSAAAVALPIDFDNIPVPCTAARDAPAPST